MMLMSVNAKKSQAALVALSAIVVFASTLGFVVFRARTTSIETLVAESSKYGGKEVRLRGRGSTGLMASLIGLGDAYLLSDGTGQIIVHSYDGAPRMNADTKEPFDVRGRLETMKEPWATIARQTGLPDVMVEEIERSR